LSIAVYVLILYIIVLFGLMTTRFNQY